MTRIKKGIEFIKDKAGKVFIKANSISFDDNRSLEDKLSKDILLWNGSHHDYGHVVTLNDDALKYKELVIV